jgi:ACT domain-containing protein
MNAEQREIRRRKRILAHAEQTGCVTKTCLYFGISRSSFYRYRALYIEGGDQALANKKTRLFRILCHQNPHLISDHRSSAVSNRPSKKMAS